MTHRGAAPRRCRQSAAQRFGAAGPRRGFYGESGRAVQRQHPRAGLTAQRRPLLGLPRAAGLRSPRHERRDGGCGEPGRRWRSGGGGSACSAGLRHLQGLALQVDQLPEGLPAPLVRAQQRAAQLLQVPCPSPRGGMRWARGSLAAVWERGWCTAGRRSVEAYSSELLQVLSGGPLS